MAVNRATRKLEEAAAISRTIKRNDKRSYELNLTGRGQMTYEIIEPVANARYEQIISTLEREELSASKTKLIRLLERTEELDG